MQCIQDRAEVAGSFRLSDEGYLTANARVARTGIQIYRKDELGGEGSEPVRVYRDANEVFSKSSLNTFAGVPITVGHPKELVDSTTFKDAAVGHAGQEVLRDGEHLKIGLSIKDAAAVSMIDMGVRDLSVGYTCVVDWTPGVTPKGEAYDARQTNIKANHIAIVPEGRAGSARLGDAKPWGAVPLDKAEKGPPMADQLQTVVAFDEAYTVNDQGVRMHARFTAALDAAAEEAKELGDKIAALEAKEVAAKDKIADLEKKLADSAITPAKLAAAAKSRQVTHDAAKALGIADKDMEDLDEDEMKSAAVKKKMGDKASGYTPEQIATAFDALSAAVPVKTVRDGMQGNIETRQPIGDELAAAYDARNSALTNAWKSNQKEAS